MLQFIKNFFIKKEPQTENIALNELNEWLDMKTKPIFEVLRNKINEIIKEIESEKEIVFENIKKLENAKLQNPNIPERVKTITEGNRSAFVKKVTYLFNNVDLKYQNFNEIIKKCNGFEKEIDLMAKSTARSYQVLNEFFAREAENIATNIKKIETYGKDIKNLIKDHKITEIEKTKKDIIDLQTKIKLKESLSNELSEEKNNLNKLKNKLIEIESKIAQLNSSDDYKNFKTLLEERKKLDMELKDIENKLFHDFSVLEKALKKYAKIAFENEESIKDYLESPVKALINDKNIKISNILNNLEKNITDNKLELDKKKSEKSLIKIRELNKEYFTVSQNNHNKIKQDLDKKNFRYRK